MKAKKDTIIRTVVLVIALVNTMLNACGKNTLPFTDEEVSTMVSAMITTCVSVVTWWKNNSFTENAIKADEYKDSLNDTDSTL